MTTTVLITTPAGRLIETTTPYSLIKTRRRAGEALELEKVEGGKLTLPPKTAADCIFEEIINRATKIGFG